MRKEWNASDWVESPSILKQLGFTPSTTTTADESLSSLREWKDINIVKRRFTQFNEQQEKQSSVNSSSGVIISSPTLYQNGDVFVSFVPYTQSQPMVSDNNNNNNNNNSIGSWTEDSKVISQWYIKRAREIDAKSGQVWHVHIILKHSILYPVGLLHNTLVHILLFTIRWITL